MTDNLFPPQQIRQSAILSRPSHGLPLTKMESDQLSSKQLAALWGAARRHGQYFERLAKRMQARKFSTVDPLRRTANEAHKSITDLIVTIENLHGRRKRVESEPPAPPY